MNFRTTRASATLFVMVVSSMLSLLVLRYWWQASMQYDLVIERERYQCLQQVADYIAKVGLALAEQQFDVLHATAQRKKLIDFNAAHVLANAIIQKQLRRFSGEKQRWGATIEISQLREKPNVLRVCGIIKNDQQVIHTKSYLLQKKKKGFAVIRI